MLLFANLGAVQLNKGYGVKDCRRLLDMLQADALVLHLNLLQEALQPEGDTKFAGLLEKIADVCANLQAPVVVKEVGWGIAARDVVALLETGVAAVDVAGAGGTSWSEVERYRIAESWRADVAAEFAGWGIPTAQCVREARASRRTRSCSLAAASATVSTSPKSSRSAPTWSASPARSCGPPTKVKSVPRISHENSRKSCASPCSHWAQRRLQISTPRR